MSKANKRLKIPRLLLAVMTGFGSLWLTCYGQISVAAVKDVHRAPAVGGFSSNQFTLPDTSNWNPGPQVVPHGYSRVAQSNALVLYVNPATLNILVLNRKTGYIWGSVPAQQELKQEQLNSDWKSAVDSPVMVNYFDASANSNMGSFQSLGGTVDQFIHLPNGFSSRINLTTMQVRFTLTVQLLGNELLVSIPSESFQEQGTNKIQSIQLYPFLGAVHEGDIPGYMFIPDGSGALMRFSNVVGQYGEPFSRQIYGQDIAINSPTSETAPPQRVTVPVFGVVHGVGHNGFLAIVEHGAYNANIVAYPSGVSTNLNWVSAQFILRYPYFQPTSQNMGGFNTFQKQRVLQDMQIRYVFLSGKEASYVGMAKAYRQYLVARGELHDNIPKRSNVPLRLDILGAEMRPGLLWNGEVIMTTFAQTGKMVDDLLRSGIHNPEVVYKGWSAGGLTGTNPRIFPVSAALGGATGLRALAQNFDVRHIPLYLYENFTDGFRNTSTFQSQTDAVRNITDQLVKRQAVLPLPGLQSDIFSSLFSFYISPSVAVRMAQVDALKLKELGITGVAVDRTGYKLYSDFSKLETSTRQHSALDYGTMAKYLNRVVGHTVFYMPNAYLLKYSQQIFDIPMSSSQYMYETDSVPFLQIVLHGYKDYFAPLSNFDANPRQELLRMIDYGAYPSFYLTQQASWELKDTPSRNIYTSRYADWKTEIVSEYHQVNQALKLVQNATLVNRTLINRGGVVADAYSNGVTILVNYGTVPEKIGNITLKNQSFSIVRGGLR